MQTHKEWERESAERAIEGLLPLPGPSGTVPQPRYYRESCHWPRIPNSKRPGVVTFTRDPAIDDIRLQRAANKRKRKAWAKILGCSVYWYVTDITDRDLNTMDWKEFCL